MRLFAYPARPDVALPANFSASEIWAPLRALNVVVLKLALPAVSKVMPRSVRPLIDPVPVPW